MSLLVKYRKDPYLSIKLIGLLASSLICGVGAAAFPEKPRSELTDRDKALKSLAATITIIGAGTAIAVTIKDESQSLEQEYAQATHDHLVTRRFQAEAAFQRNYSIARKMGIDTPEEWELASVEVTREIAQRQLPASSVPKMELPKRETSEARAIARELTDPGFLELDRLGLIDKPPVKQFHSSDPDRYAEVRSLANEGMILIVGGQGSGKTSKLGWIMATHCKKGHWVWFINPFAPAADYKGLRVLGRGLNFQEVAEGLRAFTEEARRRIRLRGIDPNYNPFNELHIHLAIDELSDYEKEVAKYDDTVMQAFWAVCTQFLRQANMSVSLVSHGDTQAMMGGGQEGKSKAIKRNIVRLYCQWKVDLSVEGGRRCAGWANKAILKADGQEVLTRIDIPEWMVAPPDYNYEKIAINIEIIPKSDFQTETVKPRAEIAETFIPQEFQPSAPSSETASETPEISPQGADYPPESEIEITERESEIFRVLSEFGHSQTEIIKAIWQADPGGSKGYKKALARYKILKAQEQ